MCTLYYHFLNKHALVVNHVDITYEYFEFSKIPFRIFLNVKSRRNRRDYITRFCTLQPQNDTLCGKYFNILSKLNYWEMKFTCKGNLMLGNFEEAAEKLRVYQT